MLRHTLRKDSSMMLSTSVCLVNGEITADNLLLFKVLGIELINNNQIPRFYLNETYKTGKAIGRG
jgi:hypothetical protein